MNVGESCEFGESLSRVTDHRLAPAVFGPCPHIPRGTFEFIEVVVYTGSRSHCMLHHLGPGDTFKGRAYDEVVTAILIAAAVRALGVYNWRHQERRAVERLGRRHELVRKGGPPTDGRRKVGFRTRRGADASGVALRPKRVHSSLWRPTKVEDCPSLSWARVEGPRRVPSQLVPCSPC